MIGAALVLALVGSFYAGRSGAYFGPAGMMGPGGMMGLGGPQSYGSPGWGPQGSRDVRNLSEARDAVEQALRGYGNRDLQVTEAMEGS